MNHRTPTRGLSVGGQRVKLGPPYRRASCPAYQPSNGAPIACRRALCKESLPTPRWHVLRHTFASHLVMRGEPLKVVQELLGHANIEATMIYAHLSASRLKQAVAKLDEPLGRRRSRRRESTTDTAGRMDQMTARGRCLRFSRARLPAQGFTRTFSASRLSIAA